MARNGKKMVRKYFFQKGSQRPLAPSNLRGGVSYITCFALLGDKNVQAEITPRMAVQKARAHTPEVVGVTSGGDGVGSVTYWLQACSTLPIFKNRSRLRREMESLHFNN